MMYLYQYHNHIHTITLSISISIDPIKKNNTIRKILTRSLTTITKQHKSIQYYHIYLNLRTLPIPIQVEQVEIDKSTDLYETTLLSIIL